MLLHGGFWRHEWGRDAIDSLAVDLARRGWTTANVEYRRLGCGGGWPVTADDIAAALDMAVAESGVDEITLVGHSAGGQLALVAARDRRVSSVLALAAVADLARALELGTGAPSLAQFLGDADPAGPASPVSEPPEVRHLLVHGTADVEVAPELTERYAEVATSRGVPVTVLRPHCGHFALVDPSTPAWADAVAGL